jgi:hypothetical protein
MWWDRHHAGQLQLLQQREQRAAGLLHQGQALRDRLTAELSGGPEGVLVSAAVAAAADASDGTCSDVDSDVGKVVSDASSDVESLALGLDAIEIEYEAERLLLS